MRTYKPKAPVSRSNVPESESRLVFEVMRELGKYGCVYRCNSGTIKLPGGKVFRGMPAGFSDIMLIKPDGTCCFIETKIGKNKTTEQQDAFIEKMRRFNCLAGVARSVADALRICGIEPEDAAWID